MRGLPIVLDIEEKKLLVVGGGTASAIKIGTLLEYGGNVIVVAPNGNEKIRSWAEAGSIVYKKREFVCEDLEGVFLVFAAAEETVNEKVFRCAKEKRILCLKADGKGDFMLPAHKKKGSITLCASTGGKYPLLAKKLCEETDLRVADRLDFLEGMRRRILKNIASKETRRHLLHRLLEKDILEGENYRCLAEKEVERAETDEGNHKNRNQRQ